MTARRDNVVEQASRLFLLAPHPCAARQIVNALDQSRLETLLYIKQASCLFLQDACLCDSLRKTFIRSALITAPS
jgi:hypothetical protein